MRKAPPPEKALRGNAPIAQKTQFSNDRKPNWDKWKLIPNAKVWQVVALSLDLDPDKVTRGSSDWMASGAYVNHEGKDFQDRLDVTKANVSYERDALLYAISLSGGKKEYFDINIAKFAKLALSVKLKIPPELAALASNELENSKMLFDSSKPNYPIELDFAMQAWQAVSTSEGKGKPKSRIKKWLDENSELSNEAKERIATVANWDKTGGATKT